MGICADWEPSEFSMTGAGRRGGTQPLTRDGAPAPGGSLELSTAAITVKCPQWSCQLEGRPPCLFFMPREVHRSVCVGRVGRADAEGAPQMLLLVD